MSSTPLTESLFSEHFGWFNLGITYQNYGHSGMVFAEGRWFTPFVNLPILEFYASTYTVIAELLEEGHLEGGYLKKDSFELVRKAAKALLYKYANEVGHNLAACHKTIAQDYGVDLREPEFMLYQRRLNCHPLEQTEGDATDGGVIFDSAISKTHEVIAHHLFPNKLYQSRNAYKGWPSYDRCPTLEIEGVFYGDVINPSVEGPTWAERVWVSYNLQWRENNVLKKSQHLQDLKMIVFTDPNQAKDEGLCAVPIVVNAKTPPTVEELAEMFFEIYFDPADKTESEDSLDTRSQNYMQYCMMSAIRTLYTGQEKTARLAEYLIQTNVMPYLYAEEKEDYVADLVAAPNMGDRIVQVRRDPDQ